MIKVIIILLIISSVCDAQSASNVTKMASVKLNWKLSEGDTLRYSTVMGQVGQSKFNLNDYKIFGQDTNSVSTVPNEFIEKLKRIQAGTDYESILTNSKSFQGVLDIEMVTIAKTKKKEKAGPEQMMAMLSQGTQLRGAVYKTGELQSFWVKSAQKNLISLLFELPSGEMTLGEIRRMNNVNLIGNDHNFVCTSAKTTNKVQLVDLLIAPKDTVAVLEYDILEEVSGDFHVPFLNGGSSGTPTTMIFAFKARAKFSIVQGRWLEYDGLMISETSGIMNSKSNQKFALILK